MLSHARIMLLASAVIFALPVQADIYKYRDSNGNWVLTDEFVPGSTKVEQQPIMTIPAIDTKRVSSGNTANDKSTAKKPAYNIVISSPANGATYQRNAEERVPVSVGIDPALQAGHRLELRLNGKSFRGYEIPPSLERGGHVLSAHVIGADDKEVFKGPVVNFNVHQPSLMTPTRAAPPPRPRAL